MALGEGATESAGAGGRAQIALADSLLKYPWFCFFPKLRNKVVVGIVSGGNIAPERFARLYSHNI